MRALFYTGEEHWSGTARATFHVARALASRRHEVLIACCPGSAMELCCASANVETVALGGSAGIGGPWDLRRLMLERDVDVTFVNAERDQLVVSSAIRFAQRGAVIRRAPAFRAISMGRSGQLALKLAPAALLVTSEQEAAAAPARGWRIPPMAVQFGVAGSASSTVAAASRRELSVPDDAVLIVAPYEPSGRARLATLLRALGLMAPRHPGIHALVVGRGADDEELRMHASALGVSRFVRFLGERLDTRPLVAAADLGWVVADGDGGALDCLTFMEFGIPIVTERSPLTQQFVADGITGLVLAPAEPAYHASTVAAFLAKPDLRRAMGKAARAKAEREFSWSAMADGLERAVVAASEAGLRRK